MAQILPNGVVIPEQTERISSAGVQEMRTLGVSVDTQLGGVTWQQGRKSGQNDAFTLPPGVHTIGSATAAENTANLPEVRPGTLIVESNAGEPVKVIRFHPHMTTHFWVVTSRNVSGAMTDWWKVDAARGHGGAYAPHTTRQAMMMHAIGGPINTGGRGAVAIRIDHGFANFKTKVLPILRTAGIVPMITYNPRNWDRAENDGVTPAEVNQWVADGWVEISNHGAHHTAAETPEALEDVIAGGLAEIEEQLPAAAGQVWGFCVPGVQSGNWMGFMPGGTPENWDTLAGSLIMKHHAFGSGYLPGTSLRVLDGTIRDGLGHATMDSATVASLRTRIDQAIAGRLGLQLMLHPSQLDEAGMMTTAQLQQVVDYIVAKRDAGDLAVLSPYQLMVADATRPTPTVADVDGLQDALDGAGRGVSVRDFGAIGDGVADDTAAFTAAFASGGPVYVPGGTYRVSGAYASGPVDLTMANDAVIQHDATGPGILIEGTETPAQTSPGIALTGDVPPGTTSFVALGHGLSPGDYFRIGSELPWDASSTNIRQGEILRVATTSGSGFTSTTPVMGGPYMRSDTAAIWRLGLIEGVTIRGGTIRGPRTPNLVQTGLLIRRARNVTVEGVRFEGIDYRHAAYEDVIDWWHDRNTHDWAQDHGMAYGVAATNASQDFQVTRNIFVDTRHAFTTSNLQAVRGVTRRGYVGHNVVRRTLPALNETSSGGDALDTHTAADDMTFEHNFVDGSTGAGINVECRNSRVRFNTILNPTGAGIHVHNESDLDGATEIIGNRVVAGPDTTYGIRVSPAGRGSGATLRGVLVNDNVIEGVQATAIYMGNRNNASLYGVTANGNMGVGNPGVYFIRIYNAVNVIYQGNNASTGTSAVLAEDMATGGEDPGYTIANLTDGVIEVQPHHTYIRFSPRDGTPLRTITPGRTGQTITFRPMGTAQQVPVATNGNIVLGAPLTLNGADDAVTLGWTGARWSEISRRMNPVIAYDTDGVPYLAGAGS